MNQELQFTEFGPGAYEQWKKAVEKELAGKSLDTLTRIQDPGIVREAYYSSDHPGKGAVRIPWFRKGVWEIRQDAGLTGAEGVRKDVLESLQGGVTAIGLPHAEGSASWMQEALRDVLADIISVYFTHPTNAVPILDAWLELARQRGYDTRQLRGAIEYDALSSEEPSELLELAARFREQLSLFRIVSVQADIPGDRGASIPQQLAWALSGGHEVLCRLMEGGYSVDEASAMIQFRFSTGADYFGEIAKYRSFRALWSRLIEAYAPEHTCSSSAWVHASTSRWTLTATDIHTNLLRSTTQAMSAVIGGANSIEVLPHDSAIQVHEASSRRLARNIQHILLEECAFADKGDVSQGAWFIEHLTTSTVQAAWQLFQEMEGRGGWNGARAWMQEQVDLHAAAERAAVRSGERRIVGVNRYQPTDTPTPVEAAILDRLSSDWEQALLAQEGEGKP